MAEGNATSETNLAKDTPNLTQLMSEDGLQILEKAFDIGSDVLSDLATPLERAASTNVGATPWLKAVNDLRNEVKQMRFVVGIIGDTGAGKSSVINALLDEERLLPTSCTQACTASPTEVLWNTSDDPEALYRAEVEFISEADWIEDLSILSHDLTGVDDNPSPSDSNSVVDAEASFAKIRAVYPGITKNVLATSSPAAMAKEPVVRGVLGTVRRLRAPRSEDIHKQIQQFVGTKEKGVVGQMEFWPLIKVVRIFTKAPVLSTGAVIVDLVSHTTHTSTY